jgi:hypothetical protein
MGWIMDNIGEIVQAEAEEFPPSTCRPELSVDQPPRINTQERQADMSYLSYIEAKNTFTTSLVS